MVAVLVDAALDVEPHALLGVDRSDVLVLASPGPALRPEEIALLEHAFVHERLALCVVLVREDQTTPGAAGTTAASRALQRRLEEARAGHTRAGMTESVYHAVLQAGIAATASDLLREAGKRARWRTCVGVLPARGDGLRWIAPWFDRPLPAELLADPPAAGGVEDAARAGRAANGSTGARPSGKGERPAPGPSVPYPAPKRPAHG